MDKFKNKFYQFPHKVGTVSKYFVKSPLVLTLVLYTFGETVSNS